MLRREFRLKGAVARARAYVTSHGLYELHLNGQRVGDELFTPGWTSYNKRLQYQTYDVTALLQERGQRRGRACSATAGTAATWPGRDRRNVYGDRLGLLLQIRDHLRGRARGDRRERRQWKAATGPILMSEIYHGETYDARLEKAGWTRPASTTRAGRRSKVAEHRKDDPDRAAGPAGAPDRGAEPVKVFKTPAGETVVDLGQNMVGWARLKVQGPAGTTVTLRHAEVLDKDGNFYTANLREAKETLRYTLKGGGAETFEPHFTFFGFRYVAVDGYPGGAHTRRLTGIVIHSEMRPTGELETSKPLLNQLQHNIRWGQKGNFLDVPTDCPQRDERLGWTGDAAGLRSDRRLQHGRGGLLHEVAEGRRRRPVRERQRAPRGARRAARLRGPRSRRAPRAGPTRRRSSRGRCT